jgi:hypothetical protein
LVGFFDELADEFHRRFSKFRFARLPGLDHGGAGQQHETEFDIWNGQSRLGVVPAVEGGLPLFDILRAVPARFQPRPERLVNGRRKGIRNLDFLVLAGGHQVSKILGGIRRRISTGWIVISPRRQNDWSPTARRRSARLMTDNLLAHQFSASFKKRCAALVNFAGSLSLTAAWMVSEYGVTDGISFSSVISSKVSKVAAQCLQLPSTGQLQLGKAKLPTKAISTE